MNRHRRPRSTHLFFVGDVRVFAIKPDKLSLHDRENPAAWIASEEPLSLREWR